MLVIIITASNCRKRENTRREPTDTIQSRFLEITWIGIHFANSHYRGEINRLYPTDIFSREEKDPSVVLGQL